jgi:hypothetical protein
MIYKVVNLKLVNYDIREKTQFSIDRIDDNIGHVIGNCQITCLCCNMKKKKNKKKISK